MADRKIRTVMGTIEFDDGESVQFLLTSEGSSRWGNVENILGDAVEPCDEMSKALAFADYYS